MRILNCALLVAPCVVAFSPQPAATRLASPTAARHRRTVHFSSATSLPEGLVKTVVEQGDGVPLKLGDIATVKYSCYLPDNDTVAPFAKASQQKVVVGDGSMIAGWDKAIRSMRVGERSVVRVMDPSMAYGASGVPPVVPSNAVVEMDLQILDAQPPTANIDFDSLATADNTPRTATDIAQAFEMRKAARSSEPELEGLDAWIEKARNFYFFGLFEGETGQQAPWFLRPSITFPLAFAVVGAAFYISLKGGAISERGAQVKDELDEIILSSILDPSTTLLALSGYMGQFNL